MVSPLVERQGAALRAVVCHSPLLPEQRVGLSAIAATGTLSVLAVVVLLGYTIRNHVQLRRLELAGPTRRSSAFFRTHVDFYMLSLLFADFLQGSGAMMSFEWVRSAECYCGTLCRVQGIISTLGETGVAMSTLVICVHTFVVVFFSWRPPKGARGARIWGTVVGFIWTYLIVCVSVGFSVSRQEASRSKDAAGLAMQDFYAPTPFWCWIGQGYMIERILFEYVWLWSAALISILLYSLLFLRMRGFVSADPERWTRIRFHLGHSDSQGMTYLTGQNGQRLQAKTTNSGHLVIKQETSDALKLLYYPAAYTILISPISVARWTTFDPTAPPDLTRTAANTPFTTTAIVMCIFCLSGLVNVTLFISTRPNILGFGARRQARAEKLRTGGGVISSLGSIAAANRDRKYEPRENTNDVRPGVLIIPNRTDTDTEMSPLSASSGRTRPGYEARMHVAEDSENEVSDLEHDDKERNDVECASMPRRAEPRLAPLPAAHTLDKYGPRWI